MTTSDEESTTDNTLGESTDSDNLAAKTPPTKTNERKRLADIEAKIDELRAALDGSSRRKKNATDFKYRSNADQYMFNDEVLYKLERAKKVMGSSNKLLESPIKALKHRNKMITLADNSEAGWKLVEEYEKHNEAFDPADDRKIKRVEKRALKKIEKDRQKRKQFRNAPKTHQRKATPEERHPPTIGSTTTYALGADGKAIGGHSVRDTPTLKSTEKPVKERKVTALAEIKDKFPYYFCSV